MATAAIVAGIVGGVAAVAGAIQQRKAGKEQRRQNEVQNRIAKVRQVRNIRRSVAASRIRRAEVQASGFEFGVAGGTAVQGAAFGVTGDLASAVGAANVQLTGQQTLVESQNRVSSLEQSAATFGSIANLASQVTPQSVEAVQGLF